MYSASKPKKKKKEEQVAAVEEQQETQQQRAQLLEAQLSEARQKLVQAEELVHEYRAQTGALRARTRADEQRLQVHFVLLASFVVVFFFFHRSWKVLHRVPRQKTTDSRASSQRQSLLGKVHVCVV